MARPLATYGEHLPGQLLVEGSNDFHVLCSLFQKRKIPKDSFGIKEKESYEQLRDGLELELDVERVETIGIIVDADESLEKRWSDLKTLLSSLGYLNIHDDLPPGGYVIPDDLPTGVSVLPGRKRLGIWVMPNNQDTGILENFVALCVREQDKPLWQYAQTAIAAIPDGFRLFPDTRLAKAHMYTWLAWQKEPGIPMGRAIMERYLDSDSTAVDPFIAWIKRLFQL